MILKDMGQTERAMTLLQLQEEVSRKAGDSVNLEKALTHRAHILKDRGDLDTALQLLCETERLSRARGDWDGIQNALGNQALVYSRMGRNERALELHAKEEAICRETGNLDDLQACVGNQAALLAALGRWDDAQRLFEEKRAICQTIHQKRGLGSAYQGIGNVYLHRGWLHEAMTAFAHAEALARETTRCDLLVDSLCMQASCSAERDRRGLSPARSSGRLWL